MGTEIQRVIEFWFNRPPLEWIICPQGLDSQIKSDFGDLVNRARHNELDDWATGPDGSLALVVLLDQFSRNIFRDMPAAFEGDMKAWDTATRAIARGFDKQVSPIQATAFYMPLMHQESLISLIAASCLWEAVKARCKTDEEHEWVDMGIAAAPRHIQQIERFGRYPARNARLGRKNTEEEEEFLKENTSSL